MAAFTEFFDSIKERLKIVFQEQQESELFIAMKEKYFALSASGQWAVKAGGILITAILILWMPVSSFLSSADVGSQFEERRQALKDLLKIERDYSSLPPARAPLTPFALKSQMDQKLLAFGVKVEQIKDTTETNEAVLGEKNIDQKGIQYQIQHVTIRQAVDIGYELEQVDRGLKLSDFELTATSADPHFYDLRIKLITFVPKIQAVANAK